MRGETSTSNQANPVAYHFTASQCLVFKCIQPYLYESSGTQYSSFGRAVPRHSDPSKTLNGIVK